MSVKDKGKNGVVELQPQYIQKIKICESEKINGKKWKK